MKASARLAPFSLSLDQIPSEACSVHRWRIDATLDEPYAVVVVLHVPREFAALFGGKLIEGRRATFSLQAQAETFEPVHGRIESCEYGHDGLDAQNPFGAGLHADVVSVTLTLRPRLWWASLAKRSQTFQRQSASDIVRTVLRPHGLTDQDIEFRLNAPLKGRRYRQQFEESDLAFVSRTLEAEGLSYFFDQTTDREVMVITDDASGWTRPRQWSSVNFVGEAGLATPRDGGLAGYLSGWNQVITRFELTHSLATTEHFLDDYNYRAVNAGLNAERLGTRQAVGMEVSYGSHAKTPEEAALRVHQQAERAMQHGERGEAWSTLTALAPGQCIGIDGGFRTEASGRWVVLGVSSWGDRTTPYSNHFALQLEVVPYRPELDTPLPEMAGFTHMRVDTTNTANPYARLDQHGRYLAWHLFEHTSSPGGIGSAPLRLARDFAGPTYGQHFPVHAGVEALAAYVHGDPDRPVLLGVVHDSRNPNHVTARNSSRHVSRTAANNKLRMEDASGQEHIKLSTEYGLSQANLGHLVDQDRKSRGTGFELASKYEAALRAEHGWLFSGSGTNVRGDPKGEGHQLHLEPMTEQIDGIRPWADNRSKAATQVGLEAATTLKIADEFAKNLPGLTTPMHASFSAVGMVYSARKNLVFGAENSQAFHAQGSIELMSAEPFGITAKKGVRLHAESGGIKQVTSNGDHTMHIQDGDFTLLASGNAMFESKNGVVRIQTGGVRRSPKLKHKGAHHDSGAQDFVFYAIAEIANKARKPAK